MNCYSCKKTVLNVVNLTRTNIYFKYSTRNVSVVTGGREKRVEPGGERTHVTHGAGKMRGNPRSFIGQNPRKVRGVHALRGNPFKLPV